MGPCILVFGLSGVGKTTACMDFARRHPNWQYLRASALLSDATGEDPETLRIAEKSTIRKNQSLLAGALEKARIRQDWAPVLVDAHAVIDNDSDLVVVPLEVVASMHPTGLILLELTANSLAERRRSGGKQRPVRAIDALAGQARIEAEAVSGYAKTLDIPLARATVDGEFTLDRLIEEVTRPKLERGS